MAADAGEDFEFCGTSSVQLIGTKNSQGNWEQTAGPAVTVDSIGSNRAVARDLTVTGDSTVYGFRYVIDDPTCPSTADTMFVTIFSPADTAAAGADQFLCEETTFTFDADLPASGEGKWTKIEGPVENPPGSFIDDTNPTTQYTGATTGTYIFEWSVENGACVTADRVRIVNDISPSTADAGPDQDWVCDTLTIMDAVQPTAGFGNWAQKSGPNTAEIVSPILPNTQIRNLVPGVYEFYWTITNGPSCPTTVDSVIVIVATVPTQPEAGPAQDLCSTGETVMDANIIFTGTGSWSQGYGPNSANIVAPASRNTTINGLIDGEYLFYWTATTDSCSLTDSVIVNNYSLPTTADAGIDSSICISSNLFLYGNVPVVGDGLWTQLGGPAGAQFLYPDSANTLVYGIGAGTYEFEWMISSTACPPSRDTVEIQIWALPTLSVTGPDTTVCDITAFQLNGSESLVGSGTWTVTSGPSGTSFNPDNSTHNALVQGLIPGNSYGLEWKIVNGKCESVDQFTLTILEAPTTAAAGDDQILCLDEFSTFLDANAPSVGTGQWSQFSGPSTTTIQDNSDPKSLVSGLQRGLYRFVWSISNGICIPSTDTVNISKQNCPPVAVNDTATTISGVPVTIPVTSNDFDTDGGNIDDSSIDTVGLLRASNGTVTFGPGDGSVIYTPAPGFFGEDNFEYLVCDDDPIAPLCDTARVTIYVQGLDYGDAPDDGSLTYNTLFNTDGASHTPDTNFYLGTIRTDIESNGQPNNDADGDDTDNTDDEDAFTLFDSLLIAQNYNFGFNAVIQGSYATGVLDAWLDTDRSGTWEDDEHIIDNKGVVHGNQTVDIILANNLSFGLTYIRFRLTESGLADGDYKNYQGTGEVEDYPVVLYGIDYADAPDDGTYSYKTLKTNDGARHIIDLNFQLGNTNDADNDPDGQPNTDANGDDSDGNNDDDGINFKTDFIPGTEIAIDVTATIGAEFYTTEGYLNIWIDLDQDGEWDPGERVAANQIITNGTQEITFDLPANIPIGDNYIRFRLTENPLDDDEFGGLIGKGEVEDYKITIEGTDYGDLPDSYGTTTANNGATHNIVPGFQMGTNFTDSEVDGQPGGLADGDDNDGNDDDDGITFTTPAPYTPGSTVDFELETQIPIQTQGYFYGWADFNSNGTFDPGEEIYYNENVLDGVNPLSFNIPPDAVVDTLYLRSRLSDQQNIGPTGSGGDGEVEDYFIVLEGRDYGDAPDDGTIFRYETMGATTGASHKILNGFQLGNTHTDHDTDGQEGTLANGDNTDGNDDETGVTWAGEKNPGAVDTVFVDALLSGKTGYFNLWADFNRDGDWDENDEHVFINTVLSEGTNELIFTIPPLTNPGITFVRARLYDAIDESPDYGGESDTYGEVEDYVIAFPGLDFGDAPDSYGTTLNSNGAVHAISEDYHLGPNYTDSEDDGQVSAGNALGDDNDGNDDDDGVTFLTPLILGETAEFDIYANAPGYLNVWLDLDRNGTFELDERIFANEYLSTGSNLLDYFIPQDAEAGISYMRFRFTQEEPLVALPTGAGGTGEVEDYEVELIGFEYGDAPEGITAYPDEGIMGKFPTCIDVGPTGSFILHDKSDSWFGDSFDYESDGNGGLCSDVDSGAPYDNDECFADGDAGLLKPSPYTVEIGYVTCSGPASPLGMALDTISWGSNIDIQVTNNSGQTRYVNVLIDYTQDGRWAFDPLSRLLDGTPVPEHMLVNFPVPSGYSGPLSGLNPPDSYLPGKGGYVWARFSIMETPVSDNWDGSGTFNFGETEDYLFFINYYEMIPLSGWAIFLAIGLMIILSAILTRRRI